MGHLHSSPEPCPALLAGEKAPGTHASQEVGESLPVSPTPPPTPTSIPWQGGKPKTPCIAGRGKSVRVPFCLYFPPLLPLLPTRALIS